MKAPSSPPEINDKGEEQIFFQSEDISFQLEHPSTIQQWIEKILKQEGQELQIISFIFCSDTYLHQINVEYLQHDTFTDIITFPYSQPPIIEGDIFISVDRVRENAQIFGVAFEEELCRVIIHGVLHLCGYPDKTPEEQKKMREKEDEALRLLHNLQ